MIGDGGVSSLLQIGAAAREPDPEAGREFPSPLLANIEWSRPWKEADWLSVRPRGRGAPAHGLDRPRGGGRARCYTPGGIVKNVKFLLVPTIQRPFRRQGRRQQNKK